MAIISNFPEKRGLNTDDINDIANGEISNGFVQSQFNYSTEEQVIGKWIDGKPLYQKTYKMDNQAISNGMHDFIDLTSLNIDEFVNLFGVMSTSDHQQVCLIPACSSAGDTGFRYEKSSKILKSEVSGTNSWSASNVRLTIQYTKTTD